MRYHCTFIRMVETKFSGVSVGGLWWIWTLTLFSFPHKRASGPRESLISTVLYGLGRGMIWVHWNCSFYPLQCVFLCLGFHHCFRIFYLNPKTPPKAILSMDGCRIIVAEGEYEQGTSYFTILLMSSPILTIFERAYSSVINCIHIVV